MILRDNDKYVREVKSVRPMQTALIRKCKGLTSRIEKLSVL
jgi:hypothetical protein